MDKELAARLYPEGEGQWLNIWMDPALAGTARSPKLKQGAPAQPAVPTLPSLSLFPRSSSQARLGSDGPGGAGR